MLGVILAGGQGQRLRPLTLGVNKHLLPVGDRPMVAHPLGRLVEAGLDEVVVVSSAEGVAALAAALGSGHRYGARVSFVVQDEPLGVADALGAALPWIAGRAVCVILGDNVFDSSLREHALAHQRVGGALVLLHEVQDPERYGVARIEGERVLEISEKPARPPSNLAVTGVYFYDHSLAERMAGLEPSARGELEITDVNLAYLRAGLLHHRRLEGRWVDAGTLDAYRRANQTFPA
ncbi:MAG: NTP transferase domain-containing protein [Polyangiaceae bacterium]|nr:NTP transferase domain-containing protein [Polyangiaceae bacterium]